MSTFDSGGPRDPGIPRGGLLEELLRRIAATRGGAQPAQAQVVGDPSRVLREIIRASMAPDPRGRRLRDAWRQVGDGLLQILREFAGTPPGEDGP